MDTQEKKQGYVYILTNPSFKEDWVKIGKSADEMYTAFHNCLINFKA